MTIITSAEQRARNARAEVRRLTEDINYHVDEASRLRKDRQKEKAKYQRALLTMHREEQARREQL